VSAKKHIPIVVVLVGLVGLGAVNLSKTYFSKPVRSVVSEVEANPEVAKAFGAPVSVALLRSYKLERYSLRDRDVDVLNFRTRVKGSSAEGELTMTVRNEGDQGWAGAYEVRTSERSQLVNGSYQQTPARSIVTGRFDADGQALPASVVKEANEAEAR
jgi:hypothetical protein